VTLDTPSVTSVGGPDAGAAATAGVAVCEGGAAGGGWLAPDLGKG
jgi:hypothetical protein